MMSSEQLERQTEQNRAEVELTIDELRARLTPGEIVDEILSYARDGGRQFTANLGRQVTNNPLPVALIGAGLAWFLFGRDAASSMRSDYHRGESQGMSANGANGNARATGQKLGEMADAASETMHGAVGGVRHAAESAGAAVSDTAHALGETASSTYHTASSKVGEVAATMSDKAAAVEHKARMAAHDLVDLMKAQPLMLVGIGLALGAAIGAAFPATDIENRVMGDTADEMKREAKAVASDQLAKAKDTAQQFVEREAEALNVTGNGGERREQPTEHFG